MRMRVDVTMDDAAKYVFSDDPEDGGEIIRHTYLCDLTDMWRNMFEMNVNHINNSNQPEQEAFWRKVAMFAASYTGQYMDYDEYDEKYTFKPDPTDEED